MFVFSRTLSFVMFPLKKWATAVDAVKLDSKALHSPCSAMKYHFRLARWEPSRPGINGKALGMI